MEGESEHSLAVPTIHTGPCDSDMIPRPLQMLICGPLSMSWSAVHTHRPYIILVSAHFMARMPPRKKTEGRARW